MVDITTTSLSSVNAVAVAEQTHKSNITTPEFRYDYLDLLPSGRQSNENTIDYKLPR